MKVEELISKLKMLPSDATVVVMSSYDCGSGMEIYEPSDPRVPTAEELLDINDRVKSVSVVVFRD